MEVVLCRAAFCPLIYGKQEKQEHLDRHQGINLLMVPLLQDHIQRQLQSRLHTHRLAKVLMTAKLPKPTHLPRKKVVNARR